MLDWLNNKSKLPKDSDYYIKIRSAFERTTKYPKPTKSNYDYEGMVSIIDLSVNKRQSIRLLQIEKGQRKPNSKWYRYHFAEIHTHGREE
jgi:hypothetical protein